MLVNKFAMRFEPDIQISGEPSQYKLQFDLSKYSNPPYATAAANSVDVLSWGRTREGRDLQAIGLEVANVLYETKNKAKAIQRYCQLMGGSGLHEAKIFVDSICFYKD